MVQHRMCPIHSMDFVTYVRQLNDLLFLKRQYHNKVNKVMYVLRVHLMLNNWKQQQREI